MKGMKVKLYPTKKQSVQIEEQANIARFVYNKALELRISLYEKEKKHLSGFEQINYFTSLKKTDEYTWLKELHSQALQQEILNLDKAFKIFFLNIKKGIKTGFPKFKSRRNSKQTFQYPQGIKINGTYSKIFLPKIGWVKMRGYRKDLIGKIKTVTVTYHTDGYYTASLLIDNDNQVSIKKTNNNTVGIDMGTRKFLTDSNGTMIKPLDLSKELRLLKHWQGRLSSRVKDSYRYKQERNRIIKLWRKIVNKRLDYIHKLTKEYSLYREVYVEDLKIKKMTKNTSGTIDKPNYDSKRKTRLNNQINQQSWGTFFTILDYKMVDNGNYLFKVPPEYSSQTCHICGTIAKEARNGEKYVCKSCGYEGDADVNAAIVIKQRGEKKHRKLYKVA